GVEDRPPRALGRASGRLVSPPVGGGGPRPKQQRRLFQHGPAHAAGTGWRKISIMLTARGETGYGAKPAAVSPGNVPGKGACRFRKKARAYRLAWPGTIS